MALIAAGASVAHAEMLRFAFDDIAGDPRDNFDVTRVEVTFDNQTGDYTIVAESTAEHPFSGSHRLYLSVFNPDTTATSTTFGVGRYSFSSPTPTTRQERSGISSDLVGWMAGERVASYDLFGSASSDIVYSVLGGNRGGFNNSDEIRDDTVIVRAPVPEPAVLAVLPWCGVLLFGSRRSR
ncbi:hypothetical protein [Posidoniimonas polymericola]|uniref:hypothetical protein n=1 Tax=Posidoniimonas polymericola TaxID=2528002 RepID=UPI0011B73D6C|nr:hypothetical protein [Posidoniimonas polymericola]